MSAEPRGRILFPEREIQTRVSRLAQSIASASLRPQIAVPVLIGAFMFAADLLRSLSRAGLDLETEFIWLRSYGGKEEPGEVKVLQGPGRSVCGRNVLLIDGVLDSGGTLVKAVELLKAAGARAILSAVAVTKQRAQPQFTADYTLFTAGPEFLFGYGMDRSGGDRSLPDIRVRAERSPT